MKALAKLLADLVGWRWAPAVGLCVASLFYVLVVVVLVPSEIGVPMTNARFTQKTLARSATEAPEVPAYPTAPAEAEPASPPPPMPVQPAGMNDFGRRGFSPPIDRPEAPPPPAPPPLTQAQIIAQNPPLPLTDGPPVAVPPPAETAAPEPPPAAAVVPNSVVGPTGLFRSMSAFRGLMPGSAPQPGTPPPGTQPGTPPAPAPAPPGAQPTPPATQPPP